MIDRTTRQVATTLTTGPWFGRNSCSKIQIGSVVTPGGAVNRVTTISSNDSASASVVATSPTSIDVRTADRTPSLWKTSSHQCSVNSCGGHANTLLALNELMTTTASGT